MQGGRDPFSGFGDPFGGFGGFGGFGRQRSLISEVFGGRDPFDDPFFRNPFGGAFESSFFGSNGGPFMNPLASGFLEHQPRFPEHQPRFSEHQPPQPNMSRGPVIEELNSDDENDEKESGTINKENPRKHGRSSKEPIVVDPDDEANGELCVMETDSITFDYLWIIDYLCLISSVLLSTSCREKE